MNTTTYTLICGADAASYRAKYANTPEYRSYPKQVSFQMDAGHSNMHADVDRSFTVMVTTSWPNGTEDTETLLPDDARQLWKQWVSKGYSRWLTQNSSEDLTNP